LGHPPACFLLFDLHLLLQHKPFLRLSVVELLKVAHMRPPHSFAVLFRLFTRQTLGHLHQLHRLSEFLRPGEAALLDLQAAEVRAWPHFCP